MDYLNTWIVVGCAGVAGTAALFFATWGMRWLWLASVIRLLPAVVLMTPAPVPDYPELLAPAFIVVMFEGLFQSSGAPGQAMAILVMATAAFLVLVSLLHWLRWLVRARRARAAG